jgi:hypothetical protein
MPEPVSSGLVRFALSSGVTVTVAPLGLSIRQALYRQAAEKYPDPDPAPFVVAPDPDAFDPIAASDPTDTDGYRAALQDVQIRRAAYVTDLSVEVAVDSPDREALLTLHAPMLARLEAVTPGAVRATPWATLIHGTLASDTDLAIIYEALQAQLPLSAGEVADGYAYFRVDVQKYVRARTHFRAQTPAAE